MQALKSLLSFCIFFFFIHTSIRAQEVIIPKKNLIKFSPVRVADLVNPGIEIAYERFYAKRFSSQLSYSFMTDVFNITPFENYRGRRISFEQRYYTTVLKQGPRHFFAVEFAYRNVLYGDGGTFIKDTALNTPPYADYFDVDKTTFSINFRQGFQIPVRRFFIEINGGLGIKFKSTRRNGIDDRTAVESTPRHPNAFHIASEEGDKTGFNFPVNFTIGYAF